MRRGEFAVSIWSNLPSTDLFLVVVNQLHRAIARRQDVTGQNLQPDGSYRLTLDPGAHRLDATLRSLGGDDERTFTAVETPASPAAPAIAALTVPMADLRQLGAYEVELVRHNGVPDRRSPGSRGCGATSGVALT